MLKEFVPALVIPATLDVEVMATEVWGTKMLNELAARTLVVAAPPETNEVVTAAIVPEVGIIMVLPPEIERLFPLMVKLGVLLIVNVGCVPWIVILLPPTKVEEGTSMT